MIIKTWIQVWKFSLRLRINLIWNYQLKFYSENRVEKQILPMKVKRENLQLEEEYSKKNCTIITTIWSSFRFDLIFILFNKPNFHKRKFWSNKLFWRTLLSWCSVIGSTRTTEYQMGYIGNQKSSQNMIQMFILQVRLWKADFKTLVGFNLFIFIPTFFAMTKYI